jgi:hypothetical protein
MMTVICVCVILHPKRLACVIIFVQYIFCMIYLLTCKHEEEQTDRGLANPHLFWCNLFAILHILPVTKVTQVR